MSSHLSVIKLLDNEFGVLHNPVLLVDIEEFQLIDAAGVHEELQLGKPLAIKRVSDVVQDTEQLMQVAFISILMKLLDKPHRLFEVLLIKEGTSLRIVQVFTSTHQVQPLLPCQHRLASFYHV